MLTEKQVKKRTNDIIISKEGSQQQIKTSFIIKPN